MDTKHTGTTVTKQYQQYQGSIRGVSGGGKTKRSAKLHAKYTTAYFSFWCVTICVDGFGPSLSSSPSEYIVTAAASPYLHCLVQ
jgi:hypothetical protein